MSGESHLARRLDGDVDLVGVASVLGDPRRCAILLALGDGRALPASRLAAEAGVSATTTSSHLGKLTGAGLLTVEAQGRHRYYRLAGPQVGTLIEALQQFAPAARVHSLREGTRANALRVARTCYDHLAGRLGVRLMSTMIDRGQLAGGDGRFVPGAASGDQLSSCGHDIDYEITPSGQRFLAEFGVQIPLRRRPVRYCVDWSEQRHHLAGGLGRGVLDRITELGWIQRAASSRAVDITDAGSQGLRNVFDIGPEADPNQAEPGRPAKSLPSPSA
jgi:DNA-binding transcriptional ArsR family regulator